MTEEQENPDAVPAQEAAGSVMALPEVSLRVQTKIGEYVTQSVDIVGRGWTAEEAADLFNYSLSAFPVLKKEIVDGNEDPGKSGNS